MIDPEFRYKDFDFIPIVDESDYHRGFKLAAICFQTECTTITSNCGEEEWIKCFDPCLNGFIRSVAEGQRLSFIVKHVPSGEDAAFFFNLPTTYKDFIDTPNLIELGKVFDELHVDENAVLENKDPTSQLWFGVAAVLPVYRGHGLQKYARYLVGKQGFKLGFKTMITDCTSDASRHSMLKPQRGGPSYERRAIKYVDWVNSKGEKQFARCPELGGDRLAIVEQILEY